MLSTAIPLFPLPNVVLFPGVFLPLHIFEARYRTMVRDVLAGERMIGITLSKPGWHQEAEGESAIYPVGCVGLVTHVEQLEDGRYNIVLRGVEKFRVIGEHDGRPYRVAEVEYLTEQMSSVDHEVVRRQRERLEHLLTSADTPGLPFPSTLSDEEVVNALAQYQRSGAVSRSRTDRAPGAPGAHRGRRAVCRADRSARNEVDHQQPPAGSGVGALSPSIHKFGDELVPSGLSAERASWADRRARIRNRNCESKH
jgi:uncharacterized protein